MTITKTEFSLPPLTGLAEHLLFVALLLPTFVIEFLPITDMLPTWTACVALVIAMRKREQANVPPPPGPGPVIDV